MAHTYSHLYSIPTTGLRFFAVYGPTGLPGMAPIFLTKAILAQKQFSVFNYGILVRNFTCITDIVEGVVRYLDRVTAADPRFAISMPNPARSNAAYQVFNIGNSDPIPLLEFIETLGAALGVQAVKNYMPVQPGDVLETRADTRALEECVGFRPSTPLVEGVARFVAWHEAFYQYKKD